MLHLYCIIHVLLTMVKFSCPPLPTLYQPNKLGLLVAFGYFWVWLPLYYYIYILKINIKWYYMTSIRKQSKYTHFHDVQTWLLPWPFLLCTCHVHICQQHTHVTLFLKTWICWQRLTARSAGELISLNQCWRKLMDKHTSYSSPWLE